MPSPLLEMMEGHADEAHPFGQVGRSPGKPAGFVVERRREIPGPCRLAVSGILRPIDRFAAQNLDRYRILVSVDLRLERPIEGPEQEIFCCRAERFRFGEFFLRGREQIALGVLFLALEYL